MVVGTDAYIGPAECTVFTEIYGEFTTSQRADVGIGPYKGFHPTNISERAGNAYANEKKKQSEAEPDVLLIAIERVQDALVLAMEAAIRKGLKNVFFVSLDAANIDQFFADDEIDLLYINFCDPWPRKKNAKRRLTYHTFLEKYKKVLKLGGQIHFKTDNANLFAWSLPEMESCFLQLRNVTDDLHANGPVGIMTGYEEKFYALGTPIHRVEAVVTTKQPRPADEKPEPEDTEE